MGAGLGGGSADGAFALKALNQVFELGYSIAALEEKAALLGSDCPFFIENKLAKVTGRGEILEPLKVAVLPENLWISIVHPGVHISTKEAFAALNLNAQFPMKYPLPIELGTDWDAWNHFYQNHFQEGAINSYPVIANLLTELKALNIKGFTSMTGSGSACYQISSLPTDLRSFKKQGFFTWQGKI
jgi:4-diphosphocytidyl-2-C-methyl-D-erythritol kinase